MTSWKIEQRQNTSSGTKGHLIPYILSPLFAQNNICVFSHMLVYMQCCPPRWLTSGCILIFCSQRNGGAKGLYVLKILWWLKASCPRSLIFGAVAICKLKHVWVLYEIYSIRCSRVFCLPWDPTPRVVFLVAQICDILTDLWFLSARALVNHKL